MESKPMPEELLVLREQIDGIDREIILALARRFAVTSKVGKLKAAENLQSVDPVREQEKLASLRALAREQNLDSDFVHELFQLIFREVVKNHRVFLGGSKHTA
ncbi:MAG: chorismate mutase [Pseudomonadales bacterium]|nr:chorismate mutase [Pseudomonadales bacterium]